LTIKNPQKKLKSDFIYNSIKRRKYLVAKLFMEVKNLYDEKYETLLKEIIEDINKWNSIFCSWLERLSSVKISILLI
jgi:hypothetical protein